MEETITKENRGKQALKSGVWYTISSISVKAILIITTPLFTRLMTTAEYGASSTFTTWFTVLNVICSLNLWYSVGRAKLDFPGSWKSMLHLLCYWHCFFVQFLVVQHFCY